MLVSGLEELVDPAGKQTQTSGGTLRGGANANNEPEPAEGRVVEELTNRAIGPPKVLADGSHDRDDRAAAIKRVKAAARKLLESGKQLGPLMKETMEAIEREEAGRPHLHDEAPMSHLFSRLDELLAEGGQEATATTTRFTFPLRSVEDVKAYLATLQGKVEFFGYEFSGAMAQERHALGVQVFVVDRRAPEHNLPCYQGDVQQIIGLRIWSIAWFVGPNCYQTLRYDDCLPSKIADGRAFFGVAMVLWCIDCPYAHMVVMEQPDTIAHDFIDMSNYDNVQVVEFRSSWLGDERDKFIRLTVRNGKLPPHEGLTRHRGEDATRGGQQAGRLKHTDYANAEARDRDRSTWLPLVHTKRWVANIEPVPGAVPKVGDYVAHIRELGQRWQSAGANYFLPPEYDAVDAQPTDMRERIYQTQRGPGRANAARAGRRAEPSDQEVKNSESAFLSLINRKVQTGETLAPSQVARYHEMVEKESQGELLFFWSEKLAAGDKACLSNYYTSGFVDNVLLPTPQSFHSVEQYMHWAKATIARDYGAADLIKAASAPSECKRLGRLVQGYDDQEWQSVAVQVVERGTFLKFNQNVPLRSYLLSTTGSELHEASPHDRRWGIGYTEQQALQVPRRDWGDSQLGMALMRTRVRLRVGNEPAVPRKLSDAIRYRQTHGGGASSGNRRAWVPSPPPPKTVDVVTKHVSMAPLSSAMRLLAPKLAPHFVIVDRGAQGSCGPNSLSYVAWLAGLVEQDDGFLLRTRVCDFAAKLLRSGASLQLSRDDVNIMPVRDVLTNAYRSWAAKGMHVTAEGWIAKMRSPRVWADQAFLKLAADMLQAEIKYYSVRQGVGLCHVDSLFPSNNLKPKACLRLVLELETHFCAVADAVAMKPQGSCRGGARAPEDWESDWNGEAGAVHAMVPTESQWLVLLEESAELAKESGMAATTAEEFEALIEAVSKSQKEAPSVAVIEAMKESLATLRREEDARLQEGIRRSLKISGGDTRTVVGSIDDTLIISEDELQPPTDAETRGGGDTVPEEPAQALTRGRCSAAGLGALTESQVEEDTLLVVPYAIDEGEPMVLLPADGATILGLKRSAGQADVVAAAEKAVEEGLEPEGQVVGFTAGRRENGARLVVVATGAPRGCANVARTAAKRRSLVSAGVALMWCTMAALTNPTWTMQVAGVAVATASHFMAHDGTTSWMVKSERIWRHQTGLEPGRAPMQGPSRPSLPLGDVTPRSLLERTADGLEQLKSACRNQGDCKPYWDGWADATKPLKIAELAPEMLDQAIGVTAAALGGELFSEPLPVYETPWLERAPPQLWEERPGCEGYVARVALDLVDGEGNRALRAWFRAVQKDAQCLEEKGPACDRKDKPQAIAIGQDQVHYCARGYVWDCRQEPCRLLDHNAKADTDWNMEYLRPKLKNYPDQRLASNALEGIRLEADVPLISIFNPPLQSIGDGYDSVQKTVRELRDQNFYDFFHELPFWPITIVGQGSRIKKLGSDKYRRTSNFSGPHKVVLDNKGNRAVPINDASRCYLIPEWLSKSKNLKVREWAKNKYAHVPEPRPGEEASSRHKFPKERKPDLGKVMRDLAILLYASLKLKQPIFVWVEDAAFYFNQFGYAPEELWKSNLLVNARPGDVAKNGKSFKAGQIVFISERRLGFGSFASSNIAQRYSNALTGWALEEFDKLEEKARAEQHDPLWEQWIDERQPLEDRCRAERPKHKGVALSDCTQTRLAILTMFTDDPLAGVVGVQRALRLLEAWRRVTQGSGLVMAGADKRQLGGDVEWIGVYILAAIGLVAVPKNKLLRARDAIARTLGGGITFGEYRALVGLLEHLRFVSRLRADVTNVLYNPHRKGGEKEDGPSTIVGVTSLMKELLERWLLIILECAGAAMTIVFEKDPETKLRSARVIFAGSSDAAGDGRGQPGIGGYLHGYYWRMALPPALLMLMHITGWETLAACVNVLVAARLAGPKAMLLLQVDALLTPYVISQQKSKSADIQQMIQEMIVLPDYDTDIAARLLLRHLSGDGNVPSDLTSRALWQELARLCELMHVKPMLVKLEDREIELIEHVLQAAANRRGVDVDLDLVRASVQGETPVEMHQAAPATTTWKGEKRAEPPVADDNRAVRAKAKHKTSHRLGLKADAIAQADYPMAWCPICMEEMDEGGATCRHLTCCNNLIHESCLTKHIRFFLSEDPDSGDDRPSKRELYCPLCNAKMKGLTAGRALMGPEVPMVLQGVVVAQPQAPPPPQPTNDGEAEVMSADEEEVEVIDVDQDASTTHDRHVVAVALVRRHFLYGKWSSLMVVRPAGKPHPLMWHDPGGKWEPSESYAEAGSREMEQEVGLPRDTELHAEGEWFVPEEGHTMHLFIAKAPEGWVPEMREMQPDYAWVPFDNRANKQPQVPSVARITTQLLRWRRVVEMPNLPMPSCQRFQMDPELARRIGADPNERGLRSLTRLARAAGDRVTSFETTKEQCSLKDLLSGLVAAYQTACTISEDDATVVPAPDFAPRLTFDEDKCNFRDVRLILECTDQQLEQAHARALEKAKMFRALHKAELAKHDATSKWSAALAKRLEWNRQQAAEAQKNVAAQAAAVATEAAAPQLSRAQGKRPLEHPNPVRLGDVQEQNLLQEVLDRSKAESVLREMATSRAQKAQATSSARATGASSSASHEVAVVANNVVEAQAKHRTSRNLGLAADSVAQADYDMASPDIMQFKSGDQMPRRRVNTFGAAALKRKYDDMHDHLIDESLQARDILMNAFGRQGRPPKYWWKMLAIDTCYDVTIAVRRDQVVGVSVGVHLAQLGGQHGVFLTLYTAVKNGERLGGIGKALRETQMALQKHAHGGLPWVISLSSTTPINGHTAAEWQKKTLESPKCGMREAVQAEEHERQSLVQAFDEGVKAAYGVDLGLVRILTTEEVTPMLFYPQTAPPAAPGGSVAAPPPPSLPPSPPTSEAGDDEANVSTLQGDDEPAEQGADQEGEPPEPTPVKTCFTDYTLQELVEAGNELSGVMEIAFEAAEEPYVDSTDGSRLYIRYHNYTLQELVQAGYPLSDVIAAAFKSAELRVASHVQPNVQVDAAAMHATSTNQGLAANSIAQADAPSRDLASHSKTGPGAEAEAPQFLEIEGTPWQDEDEDEERRRTSILHDELFHEGIFGNKTVAPPIRDVYEWEKRAAQAYAHKRAYCGLALQHERACRLRTADARFDAEVFQNVWSMDKPQSPFRSNDMIEQRRRLEYVAGVELAYARCDEDLANIEVTRAHRARRAAEGRTSMDRDRDLDKDQSETQLIRSRLPPRPKRPRYQDPQVGSSSDTPLDQEVVQYLGFTPTWAKNEPPERGQPVPVKSKPAGGPMRTQRSFKPTWARDAPQSQRANEPQRVASHPYVTPAYGKSRLRPDQVQNVTALAKRLANDRTPGRIDASEEQLLDMATAVAEARADGINPRTGSKDAFALREFEAYAEIAGFDPNLQTEWTRRFPERESIKLASWLLWRAQRAIPRSRKGVAKPMSIYQNYLALRRVFKSRDVELPIPGTVRETLRGLIRRFIRRFGIEALRPKRVEPVTPAMVIKCVEMAEQGQHRIKGHHWRLDDWTCFIVTAWMVINLSVGSRKGESTKLEGDVDSNDWFDRASVSYCIAGRTYAGNNRPPDETLRGMKEGDHAALSPKGAKCDQWGTCHGTEPIILPFHDRQDNAARWLRDIELRWPMDGAERSATPLFASENGEPFRDATFAALIMETLRAVVGESRAKLLSPHSWRVWLASSLRMCGATDARIQAMGRWLNPDSIKLYARMTKQEYGLWVDKLMSIKRIDTARTTSLPVMDAADAIAAWGDQLHVEGGKQLDKWVDEPAVTTVAPSPLKTDDRVSVYWTDMSEWFEGTFRTSRVEDADGGGKQRTSCIVYDAKGPWEQCTQKQLTYWHCLDDEQWNHA